MSALGQSETPRVSRHGVSRRVSQAPKAPGPAPGLSQGQRQSGCNILSPPNPPAPGKTDGHTFTSWDMTSGLWARLTFRHGSLKFPL